MTPVVELRTMAFASRAVVAFDVVNGDGVPLITHGRARVRAG